MVIPEWQSFLVMVSVSGGAIALLLVDLLIHLLPASASPELERMKPYLAMLFAFLVPQVVAVIANAYPTVDPYIWAAIYAVGAYGVHEILYRIIQKPVLARLAK